MKKREGLKVPESATNNEGFRLEQLATFTKMAAGLSAILSIFYLIGYWHLFGINIFEYAALTDIIKLAIKPLIITFVAMCIVLPVAYFHLNPQSDRAHRPLWTRTSYIRVWRIKIRTSILFVASIVATALLSTIFRSPAGLSVAMFFCIPAIGLLVLHPLTVRLIPDIFARYFLIISLFFSPIYITIIGNKNAKEIKDGTAQTIVERSGVAATLSGTEAKPIMYVGYIDGRFIFYETQTESVVIVKASDSGQLVLKPNPNYHDDWKNALKQWM